MDARELNPYAALMHPELDGRLGCRNLLPLMTLLAHTKICLPVNQYNYGT